MKLLRKVANCCTRQNAGNPRLAWIKGLHQYAVLGRSATPTSLLIKKEEEIHPQALVQTALLENKLEDRSTVFGVR